MPVSGSVPTRGSDARRRLLDVALERFDSDGALVSLDELRRGAGVSVGALYHHFADRRALATALYLEGLADYWDHFLRTLQEHPVARAGVREIVLVHLRWTRANAPMARFLDGARSLVDEGAVREVNRERLAAAFRWYRVHVADGTLRELPPDVVHALWLGPAHELMRHRLSGRARSGPRKAERELAEAAWRALSAQNERRTAG